MRLKAKRDASEPAIVDALEKVGAYVKRISDRNAPDLIVLFRARWFCIAVKTPKIGRLTDGEKNDLRWPLAETPEQALKIIGAAK